MQELRRTLTEKCHQHWSLESSWRHDKSEAKSECRSDGIYIVLNPEYNPSHHKTTQSLIITITITMSTSSLLSRFPWAKSPLIINAPMAGAATPRLASEVSKAGGLGISTPPIALLQQTES